MTTRPVDTGSFERIRGRLTTALGTHIGLACTGVHGDPHTLYAEERAAIAHAVPSRQHEFAAGRAAVRDAMTSIGLKPSPVRCGPDRAPVWPSGLTGSISHTHRICVAVVGRQQEVGAIGIDIEERVQIDPTLWDSICTRDELASLNNQPEEQRGLLVARLFSAKEAFYKWQYVLTGLLLDFQDVEVLLNPQSTGFVARPIDPLRWPRRLRPMAGGNVEDQDWVISWVCGHPSQSPYGPTCWKSSQ